MPTVPLYVTKGKSFVSTKSGDATTVVDLDYGEVVDIILMLDGIDMHSIHMHGNKFWVLAVGDLPYTGNSETVVDNLVDPPLLDTVLISSKTWTKLRLKADNPGMWHFHCHLLIHMFQGLQTVFNVAEPLQIEPPDSWWRAQTYDLLGTDLAAQVAS